MSNTKDTDLFAAKAVRGPYGPDAQGHRRSNGEGRRGLRPV